MVGIGLSGIEECHRLKHGVIEGGTKWPFLNGPLGLQKKTFSFDIGDFCLFTTSKQTNKADERVRGG